MAKQNAAAKRKAARRVKKNVERGQAVLDSKVQGNLLPMQHRGQQRPLSRLHRSMDSRQSMYL